MCWIIIDIEDEDPYEFLKKAIYQGNSFLDYLDEVMFRRTTTRKGKLGSEEVIELIAASDLVEEMGQKEAEFLISHGHI